MNRLGCMIVIASVWAAGCVESSESGLPRDREARADGGAVSARDAGSGAARDAGAFAPGDGGAVASRDGGVLPTSDGGPGAGDPGTGDPGTGDPGGCGTDVIPAPTAAACAASTLSCLDACRDEACFDACLARDPDAAGCGGCMEQAFLSCVNAAGCQAQWDTLDCCVGTCADPGADACYTTTCATQSSAYDACIMVHGDSCADSSAVCFPAASGGSAGR